MVRLLPLVLVGALTLPPTTHALPSWLGWLFGADTPTTPAMELEPRVGPGCVDGDMLYPGIPTEVAEQCPLTDPPEPVIITNEYDCSSYFLCDEGTAYLFCCPSGLLYDPPMLTCDDPPHVICGTRPILDPPTTTTTTTTTTTEETTTTTTTTEETTTTTTTTEETTTTTTTEDTTPHVTTPSPTTTTTTTTTTETITDAPTTTTTAEPTPSPPPPIDSKCEWFPGYTGRLPDEGDCTQYYQCDGTTTNPPTPQSCPVGEYGQMVYNPTTQECDHQWHYPCEDHLIHN